MQSAVELPRVSLMARDLHEQGVVLLHGAGGAVGARRAARRKPAVRVNPPHTHGGLRRAARLRVESRVCSTRPGTDARIRRRERAKPFGVRAEGLITKTLGATGRRSYSYARNPGPPVGHCPGCLIPAAAAAFRMYSINGRIAFVSVPMTLSSFSYILRIELKIPGSPPVKGHQRHPAPRQRLHLRVRPGRSLLHLGGPRRSARPTLAAPGRSPPGRAVRRASRSSNCSGV